MPVDVLRLAEQPPELIELVLQRGADLVLLSARDLAAPPALLIKDLSKAALAVRRDGRYVRAVEWQRQVQVQPERDSVVARDSRAPFGVRHPNHGRSGRKDTRVERFDDRVRRRR